MHRLPRAQQPQDERSGRYPVDQWADTQTSLPTITEARAARILANCTLLIAYLAAIGLAVIVVVNWARHQ
jgi:hypothetical protein